MTFQQELALTILDGLVLGAIIALFGFWLNRRLERFRSVSEFRRQQVLARTQAYLRLWSLMEPLSPSEAKVLTNEERADLTQRLRAWYYDQGNGLYLPLRTAQLFLKACADLARPEVPIEAARQIFSALRTQMKVDAGVYDEEEARSPITPAPHPRPTFAGDAAPGSSSPSAG